MRTVYLGTSAFAAEVLRTLAGSVHRPSLVVTRPDRPRGRGRRMAAPPVAETARELDLPLFQPEQVGDAPAREQIASAQPDVVVVCAFGALIREPLLSAYEMLNLHPSLLPRWRGAAPIERAIMAGDDVTGVSIMRVTAGLDSGPVCASEPLPIGLEDTYGSLSSSLAALGSRLLVEALDSRPPCVEQSAEGVTYAEKIEASDRMLDLARPAVELDRVVRALHPHIGAAVLLPDGSRLGVRVARTVPSAGPDPGVFDFEGPRPLVGCGEGALELLEVQPAGRRPMSGEDFLRGRAGRG